MTRRTDLLILRRWRDGSVHAEIPFATFSDDNDKLLTHVSERFDTLCGLKWFGKLSSSGYTEPHKIDCPACRSLIMDEMFKLDANLDEIHIGMDVLVLSQHIAKVEGFGKNDEVIVRHFGGSVATYISDEVEVRPKSC